MTRKSQSSTAKTPLHLVKQAYHHGDLGTALVEAGLILLGKGDGEAPGLREVSRAVGVSSAAVYRHFPNRRALHQAMARSGLERLAEAQVEAVRGEATPLEAFNAAGWAYVRFALDNPALYRLMFTSASPVDQFSLPPDQMSRPARLLREAVAENLPQGADAETVRLVAVRAWAQVHGLAMLALDGQLAPEAVARDLTRLISGHGLITG